MTSTEEPTSTAPMDGDILTPPASPQPDYYGSLTSPVSPAASLLDEDSPVGSITGTATAKEEGSLSPKAPPSAAAAALLAPPALLHRPVEAPAASKATTAATVVKPDKSSSKRKPFLFRLLGKKKKTEGSSSKKAAAATLQPPPSRATEEAGIDWLENKEDKSGKAAANGGLFKSFRHKNKTDKTDLTTPPRGSWTKKKPEPLTPKKTTVRAKKEATATDDEDKEKVDSITVEESYVTEEDASAVEEEGRTKERPRQDPTVAARRKAVIQDSWDFYRLICSLVCDRDRYHETFRALQKDPVYPYLNSLTSVNDSGDSGYENFEKPVVQADDEAYQDMSKLEVAKALEKKAHETLSEFVEVCKSLAGNLGVEELGIGPIKEAATALRKAQRKYDGDLLKVTDYCRALIIVDDMAALLGLLELMRDSYGDLIRRVKLSTLKKGQKAKVGGYRDCIINMEVNGHICELQVHLRAMWEICRTKGYKHYVHSLEYKTDSFRDAYASLKGLDRKSLRELIALVEDLTKPHPLDDVTPDQEDIIMDYFALAGLYYKVASYSFAEIFFSRLLELRKESVGVLHPQTDFLHRYYISCLRKQNKHKDANLLESEFALAKVNAQKAEKEEAEHVTELAERKAAERNAEQPDEIPSVATSASFWDTLSDSIQQGTNSAYDLIMDPNRKVREEEEAVKARIRGSKQVWRSIRRERYPFLEGVKEEKEIDEEDEVEDVENIDQEKTSEDTTEMPVVADKKLQEHKEEIAEQKEGLSDETKEKKVVEKDAVLPVQQDDVVEEKKEDGGDASNNNKKTAEEMDEKALAVDEETQSALDRLMDQACSLCSTNTTTSS